MILLKHVVKWLEDRKIFRRNRKSNEQRALGMFLYNAGLSYEKAGMFAGASYEAVREWYQKTSMNQLIQASKDEKAVGCILFWYG